MSKLRSLLLILAFAGLAEVAVSWPKFENALRREFWITSHIALGEKYLIKVQLPMNYFDWGSTKYPVLCITDGDWLFAMATD